MAPIKETFMVYHHFFRCDNGRSSTSGNIGFGALYTEQNLTGEFTAEWSMHRNPGDLKEFDDDANEETFVCRMQ